MSTTTTTAIDNEICPECGDILVTLDGRDVDGSATPTGEVCPNPFCGFTRDL